MSKPVLAKDLLPWLLHQIADGTRGCLDGDCPHEKTGDCVASLIAAYQGEPEESKQ